MDMASGRLPVTSRSKSTSGVIPNASFSSVPRARPPRRMWMPPPSAPKPSSAAEQSMPFDHSPRSLRRSIRSPVGMVVPNVASGTRSPTAMLNAPQQICSASPSPVSTSTSWILSALGCGLRLSTLATTMPSSPAPSCSTPSTARPMADSSSASQEGSPTMPGANSRSQERRTFIYVKTPDQNWLRKRRSPVQNSRRSSTP